MSLQKTSFDDRVNVVGDDPVVRGGNQVDATGLLQTISRQVRAQSPSQPAVNPRHDELIRYGCMYGSSPSMLSLYGQIEKVAATDVPILICGESGTGKELLARTLHTKSLRHAGAFIPVNCGAVSVQLSESELFGHEKGSFTGAHQRHTGYFERACGGTLFLDEVTEMPPAMQVKLLRVLETGMFYRVGGTEQIRADVRIVAATNRALDDAVRSGMLREDLMYRLAVVPIPVPPLRHRDADVPLLAQHFLSQLNEQNQTSKTLPRTALDMLRRQSWRGNVRELKNTILRAYILSEKALTIDPPASVETGDPPSIRNGCLHVPVGARLADVQRAIILATLAHCGGDKKSAAAMLGISLKTLYNRLAQYRTVQNPSGTALDAA